MKITQEKTFKPITIVLEKQIEADTFLSIIDKIDAGHCNSGPAPSVNKAEYEIVRKISDFFTEIVGYRG